MRLLFCFLPLILFYPQQYSKDLLENPIYWLVLLVGLINIPTVFLVFRKRIENVVVFFLGYLIIILSSSLVSVDVKASLLQWIMYISYFFIFLTSGQVISSYKSREAFSMIFLIVSLMLSMVSFYNTAIKDYINIESEGLSYLWVYWGHNHLAVLLLITIPICVFFLYRFYSHKYLRILFFIALFFLFHSLMLTFSRAASISLFLAFLSGFFIAKKSSFIYRLQKTAKILLISLVLLIFLIAIFVSLRKYDSGMEARIYHWQKGVEVFLQNPALGTGPGTFRKAHIYEDGYKFSQSGFVLNWPIQLASDTGLLGLISGGLLYFFVIYRGILNLRKEGGESDSFLRLSLVIGVVAVLLSDLVDFDLQIPAMGLFFWLFTGLICSPPNKEKN